MSESLFPTRWANDRPPSGNWEIKALDKAACSDNKHCRDSKYANIGGEFRGRFVRVGDEQFQVRAAVD
jgi:hypothetical protein